MDKIRQNIYLDSPTHARLASEAQKVGRSAQNLAAFIITEWVKTVKRVDDCAVLEGIWKQCKFMLEDGQGCLLCSGAGYVSTEVGGYDTASRFMHTKDCQWAALDAVMKENHND